MSSGGRKKVLVAQITRNEVLRERLRLHEERDRF
jgi:hypothetical protein